MKLGPSYLDHQAVAAFEMADQLPGQGSMIGLLKSQSIQRDLTLERGLVLVDQRERFPDREFVRRIICKEQFAGFLIKF